MTDTQPTFTFTWMADTQSTFTIRDLEQQRKLAVSKNSGRSSTTSRSPRPKAPRSEDGVQSNIRGDIQKAVKASAAIQRQANIRRKASKPGQKQPPEPLRSNHLASAFDGDSCSTDCVGRSCLMMSICESTGHRDMFGCCAIDDWFSGTYTMPI